MNNTEDPSPAAGGNALWKTLPEALPTPEADAAGLASVNAVEIYYTVQGSGKPLILLHGGLGNTDDWGGQIAALAEKYKVFNIGSRGHGRSTGGDQEFCIHLMATDVLAVMDFLSIGKASIVGWSDGGNIGLDIAIHHPNRVEKLFAFGANYDSAGAKPLTEADPVFRACLERAAADYERLSKTPDQFGSFFGQISNMWEKDPFTPEQLMSIRVPVAIADGEYDEMISLEHTRQMAALIPGSTLIILPGLSHFAMWQDPATFNATVLSYLNEE